jgi:hypothetical protein
MGNESSTFSRKGGPKRGSGVCEMRVFLPLVVPSTAFPLD